MSLKREYVRPLMLRPVTGPFRPTPGIARWWFRAINHEVFGDQLPEVDFVTGCREPFTWACYYPGEIHFKRKFETKQHFVAVLAHEMIHHWQCANGMGNHCHGDSFMKWKRRFSRHGMELATHGDVHFD